MKNVMLRVYKGHKKQKCFFLDISKKLTAHVKKLRQCRLCPQMYPPVVSGGPVVSKVLLVGQAPGDKEPKLGRPFAWTAGEDAFSLV